MSILNKVSTKPNPLSFRWHSSISILAYLILNAIYVERIFSLLQWSKYLYRVFVKWSRGNSASIDEKSQRINVPSLLVEVYYLLVATLIVLIALSGWSASLWAYCFAIYLLIDTSVWVLYYFFFRRFFEENYAIMHALEYTVLLPLIIVCQSACISIIWNIGIQKAFTLLLAPDPSSPTLIVALGALYTAVILGLIISNLPIENVKVKSDHKFHISIIGNGDVVKKRLLPAISFLSNELKQFMLISVSDRKSSALKENNPNPDNSYVHFSYLNCKDSNHLKAIINSEIIWIATPSYTHYSYIEKYRSKVKLLVVEKPIVIFERELEIVRQLINNSDNIFCLSYYYLEKALPFVYLQHPLNFYDKYLELSLSREAILSVFSQIGSLKRISLHLCEGQDNRDWLQREGFGGQYFETFIHLVVLAFTALDNDDTILADNWSIKDNNNVPGSYILCKGTSNKGVSILLEMGKFMERNRTGILEYENGTLSLDFDKRSVTCKFFDNSLAHNNFTISAINKPNYFIQLDMVERCYSEGIVPNTVDGRYIQIKALEWMFQQKLKNEQLHTLHAVGHAVDAVGHANDKKSAPVIAETLTR